MWGAPCPRDAKRAAKRGVTVARRAPVARVARSCPPAQACQQRVWPTPVLCVCCATWRARPLTEAQEARREAWQTLCKELGACGAIVHDKRNRCRAQARLV